MTSTWAAFSSSHCDIQDPHMLKDSSVSAVGQMKTHLSCAQASKGTLDDERLRKPEMPPRFSYKLHQCSNVVNPRPFLAWHWFRKPLAETLMPGQPDHYSPEPGLSYFFRCCPQSCQMAARYDSRAQVEYTQA